MKKSNGIVLKPIHPNAGIRAFYRRKLVQALEACHNSILYWVGAAYNQSPPIMAVDRSPAVEVAAAVRELARRWNRNFRDLSTKLARYFTLAVHQRSDDALMRMLKKQGLVFEFKLSKPIRDVLAATVHQNVGLIRSISNQYLHQVEQIVMNAFQTGRDQGYIKTELIKQFGIAERRANLIAVDQTSKATSALSRARRLEVGITEAIWRHSGAGRHKRPTHVANNGNRYNINTGWFDPDPKVRKHIHPGELINCRCISTPVLPIGSSATV